MRRASTGAWAAGTGGTVVRSDPPPLVEAELARLIVLLGLAAATIGFILPAVLQAAAGSAH